MSGRNPLVYCTIPFIAMQGYHTNTEDTGSLGYNSVCYITSRIGLVSKEGDLQVGIDVDVMLENCTRTIVIRSAPA